MSSGDQKITAEKITTMPFLFCLALVWSLVAILSQQLFWSDSEIWAATVAREFWSTPSGYAFHLKPIFNLMLWISYEVSDLFNVLPMHVARAIFFINAGFITYLTFLILKKWHPKATLLRFWGVILLSTSALFLEQIYRVRSDIIVTGLILLSLWWILNLPEDATAKQKLNVLLPALLTPFITLNAMFFLPLLLPVFWPHLKLRRQTNRNLFIIFFAAMGFLVLIFYVNLEKSYDFFIQSFDSKSTGIGYFHKTRFEHLLRWIQKDKVIFGLIGIKILHDFIFFLKSKTWPQPARSWLGLWSLILIAAHPNRMPFFLVSLLPFLILWVTDMPLVGRLAKRKRPFVYLSTVALILASVCLTFFATHHAKSLYQTHNNTKQKQVINYFSRVIPKSESLLIFDPIGILPFHDSFMWYLGPGQIQENRFIGELVQRYKPHLIFYPQRIDWLNEDFNTVFDGYTLFHRDLFLSNLEAKINIENETGNSARSEDVLKVIWQTYSTLLSPDWNFDILAFNDSDQVIPLSIVSLDGETKPLERSIFLEDLIFSSYLSTDSTGVRLEIKPIPPEDTFKNFGVYDLFRFDSSL